MSNDASLGVESSAESTNMPDSAEVLKGVPGWEESGACWADQSAFYRWPTECNSLTRARSERIYKPSNKQEWRAVYWLLVPSLEPEEGGARRRMPWTGGDIVFKKHRRRQCSFSCLKYGEDGARQRAKSVLDFINMTGFLPLGLKGNPNNHSKRSRNDEEVLPSSSTTDSSTPHNSWPPIFPESAPPYTLPWNRCEDATPSGSSLESLIGSNWAAPP